MKTPTEKIALIYGEDYQKLYSSEKAPLLIMILLITYT